MNTETMNTETDQIYVSPTGNREVWLKGQAPAGHITLEAWLEQNPEPPVEAPPVEDDPPVLFIRSDEVTIAEAEALYLAARGASNAGSSNAGSSNAGSGSAGAGSTGAGNAGAGTGTGTGGVAEAFIIGKLGL